jgi:TadE-like protein
MLQLTANRNNLSKQRGASTLEFAFVLTLILFPLMFGVIDFSRALYAYHWVAYAAREGTRWASVRGSSCTLLSGGCPALAADGQTFVQSMKAPGMYSVACNGGNTNTGCISATTTWSGKGGDGTDCTTGGTYPTNSAGCIVKVQVNYVFGFSLPFLNSVTGKTMNLQSTSQMVISQ